MTSEKILQVNYRTKKSRKEEMLYIIDRTSPKYRSINQFIDMAVDSLLREEAAAITRKEVYQHEHKPKTDRESNVAVNEKLDGDNNGEAKPTFDKYWNVRLQK